MPFKIKEITKKNRKFYEVQTQGFDKDLKPAGPWTYFGPADTKEYADMLVKKAEQNESAWLEREKANRKAK